MQQHPQKNHNYDQGQSMRPRRLQVRFHWIKLHANKLGSRNSNAIWFQLNVKIWRFGLRVKNLRLLKTTVLGGMQFNYSYTN